MKKKSRELKDITLNEISLVDRPANKRGFLLFKARGAGRGTGGSAQADGGAKYCVCPDCGYSELHTKLGGSKSTPCTKIKCPECGTLMGGSMSKAKKKINIEIESDGTKKGTTITVNGDKIDEMQSFSFSIWSESLDDSAVSCSYSRLVESVDGFSRTETYYLAKGDNVMDDRITKILKKLFGDKITKFDKVELNEETITEIVKALEIVEGYKDEFPTDLGSAIGLLAVHAGQGYKPTEKAASTESNETSAEQVKKLETLITAAQAMLPTKKADDKTATSKADGDSSELKQTVETLAKAVSDITGKMEKKEASDQLTQINDALSKVSDRLKTIEGQPASTKKSLSSNDVPVKEEVQKDEEGRPIDKWPSLVGEPDEEGNDD